MEMKKPKLYLDRETLDKEMDDYLFISYSHRDSKIVFYVLNYLYNKFVNYWYDYDLTTGKRWDKEVITMISNKHCKGCLCFVSKSYLKSEACKEEYLFMKSLISSEFHFYPIYLEEGGIEKIISEIPKEELKIKDIGQEDSLLCKEILYQTPEIPSLDSLIKDIKKANRSVLNDKECILLELLEEKKIRRKDQYLVATIGNFPQKNGMILNREAKGMIITNEWEDKFYGSIQSGLFYPLDLIEWRIVDADQERISLISNHCLFPAIGQVEKINEIIKEIYKNCFTLDEQEHISLTMLNEKNLNNPQYLRDIEGTVFFHDNYSFLKDIYWILDNERLKLVGKNFQAIEIWGTKDKKLGGIILALTIETNYFRKRGKKYGTK